MSLIQESELFWILFDHPVQRVISNKRQIKLLDSNSDIVLFNKEDDFLGGIKIDQFSLMHNSSGPVKNFLIEKANPKVALEN